MPQNLKSLKELAETARKTTAYYVQGAILDFTEDIVSRMSAERISKSDLATKIKTTPAFVTKLLSGQNNFTVETMVKVARALKSDLRIHLQPKGSISQWIDILESPAQPTPVQDFGAWVNLELSQVCSRTVPATGAPNEEFAVAA